MDGRLRAKGEVQDVDLGEVSGIDVLTGSMIGLRHEGSTSANIWTRKTQALQLEEAREIAKILAEESADVLDIRYGKQLAQLERARLDIVEECEKKGSRVPARYDSPFTLRDVVKGPNSGDAWTALQREAVGSYLTYAKGPTFGDEPAEWVAEIERLGCLLAVYQRAMEVQRLSAESFPVAESSGGDGSGVNPEPGG